MLKVILVLFLSISLYAKESLYLHIPSNLPSKNCSATSFGKELIELINNSEDDIYFAIYGIRGQDDALQALMEAQKRGVTIKGVVDSDTKGKNYYSDTHILYEHFDIVSDHKSYIMHNKFFIFDKSIVWSGSSNISDTGTGGYNANNSMVIKSKKIANIYLEEFEDMYDGKFGIWKDERSVKNITTDDSTLSIYFSPKSNTYENGIKELIQNAKEYIYIPIFYLTHKDLAQELINAYKRDVEIKIILDASAARNKYSMHNKLRDKGIKVKVENFGGKMHAKSIIIDDKYFISGSMNLTKAGNIRNDENTIIVQNEKLTKQYKQYFLKLWKSIPNKYLYYDPNPESFASGNSCFDGIDNDFDHTVDSKDKMCQK
ncbi:MAG: phospholipase D-like domain-containing protein [Campylobacterota bacterium]|nr:phospholipase D-like domain-containing protein [Campylobacterota bacterium]